MKAVVCDRYGPPEVLRFEEVAKPVPKDNEVLIRIRATTVHRGDSKIRRLSPGMGFPLDPLVKVIMLLVVGRLSRARVKGALKSAGRYFNVHTDSGTSMSFIPPTCNC